MTVQMSSLPLPSCGTLPADCSSLHSCLFFFLTRSPARSSKQDKTWTEFGKGYQLASQPLLVPGQLAHVLSAAVVRLFRLLGSVLGSVALCLLPASKVPPNAFVDSLLIVVRHQRADMMQPSTLSVQQTSQRVILYRLAQIGQGSRSR
ncbi:hypothetical protein B5807_01177 [Epicoccum nigrum]|uniref:Uncharacterized protein n=1 Tax=Epicoccum nigrum TaxID=105696 RepID=A0A1Y2MFA2_EPING|nr:hypothetical protein B5807_01177 [Epicoccum nigrum]